MIGKRIFSGHPNEEKVGYARAVVVDDWVFMSGTTGFDAETKSYPADVETQCENCFRNIERALAEAGATLADMVRVLVIVAREETQAAAWTRSAGPTRPLRAGCAAHLGDAQHRQPRPGRLA